MSSSPTQCGESPSCYFSILPTPLPLYCNPTVSFSFLSLDFGGLERWKWYRRHSCLWLLFRVGGSVCTGRKLLLYCCPSLCRAVCLFLCSEAAFTGERQPVDFGRSDCKTGRVQTSSLICLPLGRILLPYQPQDIWGWRNIFITDCVCVCDRESERKGELGWHILQIDMGKMQQLDNPHPLALLCFSPSLESICISYQRYRKQDWNVPGFGFWVKGAVILLTLITEFTYWFDFCRLSSNGQTLSGLINVWVDGVGLGPRGAHGVGSVFEDSCSWKKVGRQWN